MRVLKHAMESGILSQQYGSGQAQPPSRHQQQQQCSSSEPHLIIRKSRMTCAHYRPARPVTARCKPIVSHQLRFPATAPQPSVSTNASNSQTGQFAATEAELLPSIYDFNFTAAVNASNGWSEMWQNHFANGHAFDHIPI
ncbi:hypothetical protein KIN20_002347 [Parelaphostrongylus tenuis]|uniref:Uncharacterized protein n=1 Tax=Parelaphostrongylus tenuis TaxID=148309 RepID=A0AAD5ME25_PARTN|nr:hypothetical protein KIN20_002347 [Parelaphostrongylus tenuis]